MNKDKRDWFQKLSDDNTIRAAKEIGEARAKAVRMAQDRQRLINAAEAREIKIMFEKVADGSIPMTTSSPRWTGRADGAGWATDLPSVTITPESALDIILKRIENAGDADQVLAEAGKWITRFTNAVTDIIRDTED